MAARLKVTLVFCFGPNWNFDFVLGIGPSWTILIDSDGKDVTIVFMQKVEVLLILMIFIFILLCFQVIFGVIM